jgi:hypothetical protein
MIVADKEIKALDLNIGGVFLSVVTSDGRMRERITGKYLPFIAKRVKGPRYILRVAFRETGYSNISVDEKGGGMSLVRGDGFRCVFNKNDNTVSAVVRPEITHFDRFLRVLYSKILSCENGILVHGAGVCIKERGYLFAGPSSSGKTTLARKFSRADVLSDELTIVRVQKKGIFL